MQSRAIRNQGCCCHPPSLPVPRGGAGLKTPPISQGFVPNQWHSHSPTSLAGISWASVTFLVLLWARKLALCTLGRIRALLAIAFRGIWVTAWTWGHAEGACAFLGGQQCFSPVSGWWPHPAVWDAPAHPFIPAAVKESIHCKGSWCRTLPFILLEKKPSFCLIHRKQRLSTLGNLRESLYRALGLSEQILTRLPEMFNLSTSTCPMSAPSILKSHLIRKLLTQTSELTLYRLN